VSDSEPLTCLLYAVAVIIDLLCIPHLFHYYNKTDNGSEFFRELEDYERGIEHYFNYPRSPKTNAHVERFIQTIEKEPLMIKGTEPTVDEMNRKLFRYLSFYNNFVRPHQGLGYKTPVEKFEEYIKKHQVSTMY
jgi:transposase InsO family protein